MLPIGALFAFVGRQIGRLLQLAFNWATLVLFGQVAKDKQLFLSLMAALSLVWPVALAGVAIPSVGTFLLGFVTVPDWADLWVRIGMLVLALLAPLGVGYCAIRLRDSAPHGAGIARALFAGYPSALALAVVLVWLMVVTPVTQVMALLRRWDTAHVAIAVKPGAYDTVVDDLRAALERADLPVRHTFAPWPFTLPGRVLALVGGAGVRALVPQHLSQLRGAQFVMTIHPMDLSLSGKTRALARARSAIVRELTFTHAYQTWTKEAQRIEDDLLKAADYRVELAPIGDRINAADIPFEEWEILYRMLLQVRLRTARVSGADAVSAKDGGHRGLLERLEAAVATLTAKQ
ncbi:MAG TPA: hypothetical protein VEU77_01325 [Candidatus Acidoferrales bacterium]|nr:hypothetical protein [Candidatus Acidoferrales bacterium]